MDEVMAIAKKNNLKVLEDAAEGLGSEYKGKKAGSIADAAVFSFHGTKTISTGEGGMLVTNNSGIYERAKILNDHGRDPKVGKTFWMAEYGYKYKISNLQAAMGCAQIERAEELIDKKRLIFNWYKDAFKNESRFLLNPEPQYARNSYWMPTIVFDKNLGIDREKLFVFLKNNNIDTRPFFYPLSSLPMFEEKKSNEISYDIYNRGINLPSYHDITIEEVKLICELIKGFINLED
jgi:perosamine synthetase